MTLRAACHTLGAYLRFRDTMIQRTYITTGERIRTYLSVAFLLSLMINAAGTLVMPDLTRHRAEDEPLPTVTIDHRHPATIHTPRPTPPPTPAPRRPRHLVSKPIAVMVPHASARSHQGPVAAPYVAPKGASDGSGPDVLATVGPVASALPATPAPLCSNPNQDASVTDPVAPEYPDSARDMGYGSVSVLVQVTLDARGSLVDAKIAQSSGNGAFDRSALRAARESTYAPRIANCQPAAGTYIFRADFQ